MEDEIVQELKRTEDNIDASFAIAGALEGFKNNLMDQLWDSLSNIKGYWTNNDWTKAENGFYYRKEGWENYEISFVFEYSKLRSFYYGIRYIDFSELSNKQKDILKSFEPGKSNEYYAWWKYFEGYDEDWNTSAEPWKAIQNGNMKKSIEKKRMMLENVVDRLEKAVGHLD